MIYSGSRIVIETLIEQGATDVFGYPGGQVLNIYDELYKAKGRIRHFLTAHEQGAAHAADGYARASGKVGVVIATSGPGATNLVTGIATAMLDSVPMVAITGNVPTFLIGKDSFQEVNITGITLPITKHNYFVTDVRELADTLREAFAIARSGRPGPVLVDIPKDVQIAECEYEPKGEVALFPQRRASDAEIEAAAELINASERPYIYIGGGAAAANLGGEVRVLTEKVGGCAGCSLMGLSVLPDSFDAFLGMQGMHGRYASTMAMSEADLILGIGVRFSDRATGSPKGFAKGARLIQLDIDPSEIDKNVKVDVGIVGDAADALCRLTERCKEADRAEWKRRFSSLKLKGKDIFAEEDGDGLTPKRAFDVINAYKSDDDMIVTDVGQHQMWTAQHIRLFKERRFASSGGLGTMGYGLGAAIGAHVGCGSRVLLITGDGSFGMDLNELATAVTYKVPVVVVIMNNGVLGMVRQWQTLFYGKRYSCTELDRKTDFVLLAKAFGLPAARATTALEFEEAFKEALTYDGPYLIDAVIEKDELVLPMIPPNGHADDLIMGGDGE